MHQMAPTNPPPRDFPEALRVTSLVKSSFSTHSPDAGEEDLYARGDRLIRESVEAGVTTMRAHVEVDETVHYACLDAGLRLRKLFRDICHIQIAGEPSSLLSSSCSCG